jgi:hypothetical protein
MTETPAHPPGRLGWAVAAVIALLGCVSVIDIRDPQGQNGQANVASTLGADLTGETPLGICS